jgi:hypothetical protein
MKTNGWEQKTQTLINTATANWFSTKEPKAHNREKTASSTNVAKETGYPHTEDWNWIHVSHSVPISTQSGSKILI